MRTPLLIIFFGFAGLLPAQVITEFVANASSRYEDDELDEEDWIEISHSGSAGVESLDGLALTNDISQPSLWTFPAGVSLAPGERIVVFASGKDRGAAGETLHTNFKLSAMGGVLQLVRVATNARLADYTYPAQVARHSYGIAPTSGQIGYLAQPTPEAENVDTVAAGIIVDGPTFSYDSQLFTQAFSLAITAPDSPMGEIRYTTDGTLPDASSTLYSAPISIAQTTRVRARIFETGRLPSEVSGATYTLLTSSVTAVESTLPIVVVQTFGRNIDAEKNPNRPRPLRDVELTFIDTDGGVASLTSPAARSYRAGLRVRGQVSAKFFPKKQYRFELRGEDDRDDGAALLGLPEDSDWILHAPFADKSLLRNKFIYNLARDLNDQYGVRTRPVEVYYDRNGGGVTAADYHGIYLLMETIKQDRDRIDVGKLNPRVTDPDLIAGGYIFKKDKGTAEFNVTTATERQRFQIVEPKAPSPLQLSTLTAKLNAFESALHESSPDPAEPSYLAHVDLQSFIDNHLLVELAKNIDGFRFSSYYSLGRDGKIRAVPVWDYNFSMGSTSARNNEDTTGWYYQQLNTFPAANAQYPYYHTMRETPRFLRDFWDRYFELRRTVLSDAAIAARISSNVAALQDPIAPSTETPVTRNFVRWNIIGKAVVGGDSGFADRQTYAEEVAYWQGWLLDRVTWMDAQSIAPPAPSTAPGIVSSGTSLQLTAEGSGDIYYTTDGSDPWDLATGAPSANAQLYSSAISISSTQTVKARERRGTDFGALSSGLYEVSVVPASPANLVITQLNYHPADETPAEANLGYGAKDFEWIELQNISASTISLTGLEFTNGVEGTLGGGELAAGQRLILPANLAAFQQRYPSVMTSATVRIGPAFSKALSNGGETVEISDADGNVIISLTYSDEQPWPQSADGDGYALVATQPSSMPNDPFLWRSSRDIGGTPGVSDTLTSTLTNASDADGDGLSDLFEFALGSDHMDAASRAALDIEVTATSVIVRMPTRVGVDGIGVALLESADLGGFSAVPAPMGRERAAGSDVVEMIYELPFGAQRKAARHFFQMSVTLP